MDEEKLLREIQEYYSDENQKKVREWNRIKQKGIVTYIIGGFVTFFYWCFAYDQFTMSAEEMIFWFILIMTPFLIIGTYFLLKGKYEGDIKRGFRVETEDSIYTIKKLLTPSKHSFSNNHKPLSDDEIITLITLMEEDNKK